MPSYVIKPRGKTEGLVQVEGWTIGALLPTKLFTNEEDGRKETEPGEKKNKRRSNYGVGGVGEEADSLTREEREDI